MRIEADIKIKDIKIGNLLKIRRENLKMSQVKLARKLNVSPASIEHKESGIRGIDLDFLKRWCGILGLEFIFKIKEAN